jgi:hypothetical protein
MTITMTDEEMVQMAWGNVERNLGCVAGEDSEDDIYDEAYTLAFDVLADAGITHATARAIAARVAQSFAQP